jgi:hypothetical protein
MPRGLQWFIPFLALAGVLANAALARAADAVPAPSSPRAYSVEVFDRPAGDPQRKQVAQGILLFADRLVRFSEVPEKLRDDFLSRYREIYFSTEVEPTGCFTLTHLGSERGSIGVLAPYGLVGWQTGDANAVTGRLYQSPDSTYDLTLTEKAGRLEGIGKGNLGFRSGAMLVEYFTGTRLPAADLTDCFRDALASREHAKPPPR